VGFVRQVLFTYTVRVIMIPVGLLYAVINARWLGPQDLGILSAIGAFMGVASHIGNLGLPTAVTRCAAAEPRHTPALVANARLTGAVAGLAACAALFGLCRLAPRFLGAMPPSLLMLAALTMPLTFGSAQLQAILLGRRWIRSYSLLEALGRVLNLLASALVLLVLGLGLRSLVIATLLLALVQFVNYHVALWPDSRRLRPDLPLLLSLGGFSARAYLTALLTFLVLRSDIVLLNALRGPAETGVYSIAAQIADFMLLLPGVAGTLLAPRIAAHGDDPGSAGLTAAVCRHAVLAVTAVCVAVGAAAFWAVPLLFGPAYLPAVRALWILLPGVWGMALQYVLANDLSGRDFPAILPAAAAVALTVNVGLNLLWLPRYGFVAAAASSSIAYVISFMMIAGYWLRRFPEVRLADLFLLERDEWRGLAGRLRSAARPPAAARGGALP